MSHPTDAWRAELAGRYTLERELGRGGMATVYLAHDLRYDRPVALKLLHPELAAAVGPARFQREIRLAARLQHPHILTVLDSGDTAGRLWYAMPYVEGESLRDRLAREYQLGVEEAVRLVREAALALDYAHRHGVIHRDIKPENILVSESGREGEGQALVADFGIARALDADDTEPGERSLTESGVAVGTPQYMSPEQAAGERALDGRTDVYSLGCVLYELLAGEPPFTGASAQAIIAKRFAGEMPPLRLLRPAVPEALDAVVRKALAILPADRYATATDFARALGAALAGVAPTDPAHPVAAAAPSAVAPSAVAPPVPRAARRRVPVTALVLVLGFLLGVGALFAWRSAHRGGADVALGPTAAAADAHRLAVLPFDNLGDSADAYFADGVTDEVRGKLASLPDLEVIARTSSSQYRHSAKPPQQIAHELGVRYLLTGTVRWEKRPGAESRVRVSPELIDAAQGTTRWQQPFDAPLTDVFQVQADIAGKVAAALDVALGTQQQRRLGERPTASLEAYDAFLQGDEMSHQASTLDPAALRRALPRYRRAAALDSGFALAWARLARLHAILFNPNGGLPADSAASAQAAARAVALAPELPEARLALGDHYNRVLGDYRRALEQFELGRRLAPGDGDFYAPMSVVDQSLGRWEDAVAHAREGFRLDPRSSVAARYLARALLFVRRYDEAQAAANRAMELNPAGPDEVWIRAVVHIARGDLAGARAVYREAGANLPRATVAAYMAQFWELAWTLEPSDLDLLVGLSPAEFGGDRAEWGLCLAQAWSLKGDSARARVFADSARLGFEAQIRANARNDQAYALLGLTLAYLRRYDEALAATGRGVALRGIDRHGYAGVYNELQLARIYAMAGRREQAVDELERLLRIPSFLAPGWVRIDPTFAALRGDPRFERLVRGP